jgi:chromosome segregation ATPase
VTLRRLVEDLQSQLVEAHKQTESLGNTLKERDAQIEKTLKERDALRGQLVERDANIETLQRQLTVTRIEIQSLREAVKVSSENLSLIVKSNQAPEHIKSVLHQGPKPALGEQECSALELSKEL